MSTAIKASFETLIGQLKSHPEQSNAIFQATSTIGKQLNVKAHSGKFEYNFDEPEVLGGNYSAPNPVEYVLGSLGACQAIVYRALASLQGIEIQDLTVKSKGHLNLQGFLGLDEKERPGFSKVEFETIITSNEDPAKLLELSKLVESFCPVLDIISNPTPVQGKITIKKTEDIEVAV